MVAVLLGLVNTMLYLATLGRDGAAEHWRQVLSPLLVGLALALCEIALIGLARDMLLAKFGPLQ